MASNVLEKINTSKKDIEFHRPTLSKEELQTVLECLVDDLVDSGSIVEKFEKEFKSTFSYKNVISANSLFSAYHLALLSLGVSENDKVVLSSFAPLPAYYAILMIKAIPCPVDLGKLSFQIDPEKLNDKISEVQPKLIIFDHTFGSLIDISKFRHTSEAISRIVYSCGFIAMNGV